MSDSTSLEASSPSCPFIRWNIFEQIRSDHEEIERLQKLVINELKTEQPSPVDQGHRLRSFTSSIIIKTEKLVKTYETNAGAIKDEIPPLAHQISTREDVLCAFLHQQEEILGYHRMLPSERLVYPNYKDYETLFKEEPVIAFTKEEGFGRYLDLHHMYNQYINSEFGQNVEYSAYLDVFSQPEKIPRRLELPMQYTAYVEALLEYLIGFFKRTEPLQDLDRILYKVESTNFKEQYADLKVGGLRWPLIRSVHYKRSEKHHSLMEAKVKKLCNLLDETIKRTKQKVEKRQALAFGDMEIEEEEAHTEPESARDDDCNNPLNRVMGWDGKPIPYWLRKLGLGQVYKCEICGNKSYVGKRAFERHFKEPCHEFRLCCSLGIPSKEEFDGITSIEEAKELLLERMPLEGNEVWERMPKRQRLLQPRVVVADGNLETETEKKRSNQVPAGVAIPPPDIRSVVKRTAGILSIKDSEFERKMIDMYGNRALFKFLKSSHLYHAFFQHKLAKYRAQNQEDPARVTTRANSVAAVTYSGYDDYSQTNLPAEFKVPTPRIKINKFTCRLPNKGITPMELDVIKLTAQFWTRYGSCFWDGGFKEKAIKDPLFEFMKPNDYRFNLFQGLFDAYLGVLRRPENWKEELRKNAADVETVLENCFHCLQWDRSFKERMEKAREKRGRKVARIDEAFGDLVKMRELALRPAKPDPNRPKIDESELVPEDQFLAQQPPGCATIWIYVPKAMDAYIEIIVQSLSETVGSLKEKIDRAVAHPVSKQTISGKTGVLMDNKSLSYYNVGAGEMLTMSVEWMRGK